MNTAAGPREGIFNVGKERLRYRVQFMLHKHATGFDVSSKPMVLIHTDLWPHGRARRPKVFVHEEDGQTYTNDYRGLTLMIDTQGAVHLLNSCCWSVHYRTSAKPLLNSISSLCSHRGVRDLFREMGNMGIESLSEEEVILQGIAASASRSSLRQGPQLSLDDWLSKFGFEAAFTPLAASVMQSLLKDLLEEARRSLLPIAVELLVENDYKAALSSWEASVVRNRKKQLSVINAFSKASEFADVEPELWHRMEAFAKEVDNEGKPSLEEVRSKLMKSH